MQSERQSYCVSTVEWLLRRDNDFGTSTLNEGASLSESGTSCYFADEKQTLLLDRMLKLFQEKKLLKNRGKQRTDSTHVLAAIRVMNRLELVIETALVQSFRGAQNLVYAFRILLQPL